MFHDAKHGFLSEKREGCGLRSFTRECMSALLRDIEVHITNDNSLPAHALITSLEEATKQRLWNLNLEEKIPSNLSIVHKTQQFHISGKKTLIYQDTFESPTWKLTSFDHTHLMSHAITSTCALGFMLRDLNNEFCARYADELLSCDNKAKALGSQYITTRASLGAVIGEGNHHFLKNTMLGHIYLFVLTIMEEACKNIPEIGTIQHNIPLEELLSWPMLYKQLALFPGEISVLKLASNAWRAIEKFKNDYKCNGSYYLIEWRTSKATLESHHI
jgi:hypothetical protein